MKSRFVKDLNRLNISDIPHLTAVNTRLYKYPQLKPSFLCHFADSEMNSVVTRCPYLVWWNAVR